MKKIVNCSEYKYLDWVNLGYTRCTLQIQMNVIFTAICACLISLGRDVTAAARTAYLCAFTI